MDNFKKSQIWQYLTWVFAGYLFNKTRYQALGKIWQKSITNTFIKTAFLDIKKSQRQIVKYLRPLNTIQDRKAHRPFLSKNTFR